MVQLSVRPETIFYPGLYQVFTNIDKTASVEDKGKRQVRQDVFKNSVQTVVFCPSKCSILRKLLIISYSSVLCIDYWRKMAVWTVCVCMCVCGRRVKWCVWDLQSSSSGNTVWACWKTHYEGKTVDFSGCSHQSAKLHLLLLLLLLLHFFPGLKFAQSVHSFFFLAKGAANF